MSLLALDRAGVVALYARVFVLLLVEGLLD